MNYGVFKSEPIFAYLKVEMPCGMLFALIQDKTTRGARMRQYIVTILILIALFSGQSVAELTPGAGSLLPFESEPEKITFSDSDNPLIENLTPAYGDYLDGRPIDALEKLYQVSSQYPKERDLPEFILLEAEVNFILGLDNPEIQFDVAKKKYTALLYQFAGNENEALILYRLGTILRRQGLYPEAQGMYEVLLERYPDSKYAHHALLGLADCEYAQERFERALNFLRQAHQDENAELYLPQSYAIEAQILFRKGDLAGAMALFKKASDLGLNVEQLSAEGAYYYGETLFESKMGFRGYQNHQRLLSRDDVGDFRPDVLLRMADYEYVNDLKDEAIKRYEILIRDYPETEAGLMAVIRLGDIRAQSFPDTLDMQVVRYYQKIHNSIAPQYIVNIAAERLAAYNLAGGQYETAMRICQDLLHAKIDPEIRHKTFMILKNAFKGFCRLEEQKGDYGKICDTFNSYKKQLYKTRPDKQMCRAIFDAYEQHLLYDTLFKVADDEYMKVHFLPMARLFAAKALVAKGENQDAAKLLRAVAATKEQPEMIEALYIYSMLQSQSGDIDGAINTLAKAVTVKTISQETLANCANMLATRYIEKAEYEKGETWFTKAVNILDPEHGVGTGEMLADSIFGLADVEYRLGKKEIALRLYRSAVGGFGDDVRLGLARARLVKLETDDETLLQGITDSYWRWVVERMEEQARWAKKNFPPKG